MKILLMTMLGLLMLSGMWAADDAAQKPFDLTTLLGQTYKNCTIMKATPEALTLVHDSGVSKISFEQLSDEWKQKFNYDPAKAKEFAVAEDARRQEIEAKKKALNAEREKKESENIANLAEAEKKRLAEEALRVKAEADLAKAAPMVGPPVNQVTMTTEAVVPAFTPISQAYAPGTSTSQRFIIRDGAGFFHSGSSSGFGSGFGCPPIYGGFPISGGFVCPPPQPICRPPVMTPQISGTIRVGNS
ncbi:MAG: hypothetical protein RL693_385, partial [Verrucomicrobiota bacterium]